MQPSSSSVLAFSAQITAGLEQLTQAEWVYGPEPSPAQELVLLRTHCQLYNELLVRLPAITDRPETARTFVGGVLPSMEGIARNLEAFVEELTQHDPYGAELSPALELLGHMAEIISTLQQRYLPTDARP